MADFSTSMPLPVTLIILSFQRLLIVRRRDGDSPAKPAVHGLRVIHQDLPRAGKHRAIWIINVRLVRHRTNQRRRFAFVRQQQQIVELFRQAVINCVIFQQQSRQFVQLLGASAFAASLFADALLRAISVLANFAILAKSSCTFTSVNVFFFVVSETQPQSNSPRRESECRPHLSFAWRNLNAREAKRRLIRPRSDSLQPPARRRRPVFPWRRAGR